MTLADPFTRLNVELEVEALLDELGDVPAERFWPEVVARVDRFGPEVRPFVVEAVRSFRAARITRTKDSR